MPIKLSDSIRVGQQKPLEDKYFNELVPYTSTSQVNTLLPKAVRHIGLTVNINKEEYWYKDGIEDSNLVLKVSNTDALILKNQEQDGRLENLEGENASQYDLINDLSSELDYERSRNAIQDSVLNNLKGINYTWSPTNRTLTLFDRGGTQLSQVSLVSLDNEGTDIRYNADTLSLELYNADNELLDSIPVSSFVGSVGTQLQLNSNELQLKDSQGNVLSTVSFSVVNIPGLQTALDSKLDKGSYPGNASDLKTEIDGKLNKPITTSNTTSYPFVVGEDGNGNSARLPVSSLGGNVDTSNLVPYTGANKDVNIASNYFKTSKGFDFTKDADNFFRTFHNGNYNTLEFSSKDISSDNFGKTIFSINPEEGMFFQKYSDSGNNNIFQVYDNETYSLKKFVTLEGYQIIYGTATQALTADGGVFDLNTKADLVGGKVPQSQSQGSNLSLDYTTNILSLTDASGAKKNVYLNNYEEVLIKTYSPTFDPSIDPLVGKFWFNITNGKVYFNQGLMWQGQYQLITTFEKNGYDTAYTHSQTKGNPHNTTKADIGLGNVDNTSDLNKPISNATQQALNNKLDKGTYTGNASDLKSLIDTKADLVGGKIPASQLPAYVDDVLEFANLASFPATGESGKIYIAIDTNLTYRWGGSSYVVMSSSLALGETSSTAYRGDLGDIAYDHSQATGNPHNTKVEELSDIGSETTTIADTDVILKKEVVGGLWRKITFANFKSWFTTELTKKINIGLDTVFNFKDISAMALSDFRNITPNIETIYFTEEQNSTGWQQVKYNSNLSIGYQALTESVITINSENFLELDSDSTFNLIDIANTKINGIFENDFMIITFSSKVATPSTPNQWFKLILKVNGVQVAVSPVFYLLESAGTPERISHSFALNVTPEMITHGITLHIKPSVTLILNSHSITVARVHKSTSANL